MTSILVADDQALVRGGFRLILEAQPDLTVCGEAADGRDAVRLTRQWRPDVILMDIRMPHLDGIAATRLVLAEPNPPRVLVLTTFDLDQYVYEALRAGASGYLLKDVAPSGLVASVRAAAAGDTVLAPAVTRRLVQEYVAIPQPGQDDRLAVLTAREREVLAVLARGLTNAELAAELVVSSATVKTHVANLLGKLGLRDRTQAVILAYETGLIRPRQG